MDLYLVTLEGRTSEARFSNNIRALAETITAESPTKLFRKIELYMLSLKGFREVKVIKVDQVNPATGKRMANVPLVETISILF